MKENLKKHVDELFKSAEQNQENHDLKDELLGNLYEKYDSFIAKGMSKEAAYQSSISGIGDISGLFSQNSESTNSSNSERTKISKKKEPEESDAVPLYTVEESEKKKNLYPIYRTVAIVLYILSIVPVIAWDFSVSVALMFFIIATATAILVYMASTSDVFVSAQYSDADRQKLVSNRKTAALLRATAVGLYIIAVTPTIIFDNNMSAVLMFVIIALATAIMILLPSLFPMPEFSNGNDDDGTDKNSNSSVKKEAQKLTSAKIIFKIISCALWIAVTAFYLIISIVSGKWLITWMIFPIAGFISGIISGIFNLVSVRKIPSSIVKISLCSIFLCIFLPLFLIGMRSSNMKFDSINMLSYDSSYYSDGTGFSEESANINSSSVSSIDISWVAGDITIKEWDEETIYIYEESNTSLDNGEKFSWKAENGKLVVKYARKNNFGISFFDRNISKNLIVYIPKDKNISEFEIEAASADIYFENISCNELDINTASGCATLENVIIYRDLDVEMVSGKFDMSGEFQRAKFDMVSGNIEIALCNTPISFDYNGVSGDVTLKLPEDIAGFRVKSDSVSDDVSISYNTTYEKGEYFYGDQSFKISIDSVSGRITVD